MSGVDLRNVSLEALQKEVKRRFECSFKPRHRVVLMGPGGCGKGTQASLLSKENCWCHISSDDLLREEAQKGTDLGRQAKEIMDKGGLVSDDIVLALIKNKINEPVCSNGAIFDGFPMTLQQAQALDTMLESQGEEIDKVIEMKIPYQALVERITGRRIHQASGRTYHLKFAPSRVDDIDDITGEPLIQRTDDTEEALTERMSNYHRTTTSILNYYANKGRVTSINANREVHHVWRDMLHAANSR